MTLIIEKCARGVAHLRLNRPEALNALNAALIDALLEAVQRHNSNPEIGCIVLYGTDRAFVAGADIKAMLPKDFADVQAEEMFVFRINDLAKIQKPLIAVVEGYALGGGCELAMACDIILASEKAQFAQPEITLGTIPGLGGTQRLTRAVGKAKAMDLVLSGRRMKAEEAERAGLVSRIVPSEELHAEATKLAETIAGYSHPVVKMAKQAVNLAAETTLSQGLQNEKQLFEASFALEDRREGMTAFAEKRKPVWQQR